jgi:hypothetical protein
MNSFWIIFLRNVTLKDDNIYKNSIVIMEVFVIFQSIHDRNDLMLAKYDFWV